MSPAEAPLTLTEEDRKEIDRVQIAWTDSPWSTDGSNGMRVLLEAVYAALAARARQRDAAAMSDDALIARLNGWVAAGKEYSMPKLDGEPLDKLAAEAAAALAAQALRIAETESGSLYQRMASAERRAEAALRQATCPHCRKKP